MAYLQSNEVSSEEIVGVVDGVLLDVSESVSQSSEEHNGIRLVSTDDSTPNTTITATRIIPKALSAFFVYYESCNFPSNQTLPRKKIPWT